jgi:hypothetical protein
MHGFSPKEAKSLASTLPLIESPPSPPLWGSMPFAVFSTMIGGIVPLRGIKGARRYWVADPHFKTGFQNHFIVSLWMFDLSADTF